MGFSSILKLKTDCLPAKMSHFVVDKFSGKDMAIKLNVETLKLTRLLLASCWD
ncbi:hypothetical protein Hanom_Chr07g00609971 [Helianthus anomalus]